MNGLENAVLLSSRIGDAGIAGLLFLGIVFLYRQLKDKRKTEEALSNLVEEVRKIVEINGKYREYYEKLIDSTNKDFNNKCAQIMETQNEMLKELKRLRLKGGMK